MKTLGNKISRLRHEAGFTQEELAEKLDVSPQAVSKWENDLSTPDIQTLVRISDLFDASLDWLLRPDDEYSVRMTEERERKPLKDMIMRIVATDNKGETAKINLPMPMVKLFIRSGISVMKNKPEFSNIDFNEIMYLVESGVVGKIIEVTSENGEHVEIYVE